ncbi:MAG: class D sortase [Clostridium sp.]
MRKFLSYSLIIMGICIILYPTVVDKYHIYQQKELLEQFETLNLEGSESEENTENTESTTAEKEVATVNCAIKIDKINLYQAIIEGTTKSNLNVSVTTMSSSVKPGDIGNYVLAGHRSFTYGRDFNRLNELEAGDEIKIMNKGKEFKYIITDKFLVLPTQSEVALNNSEFAEITLITCDPMVEATHRLIVKGKLVE